MIEDFDLDKKLENLSDELDASNNLQNLIDRIWNDILDLINEAINCTLPIKKGKINTAFKRHKKKSRPEYHTAKLIKLWYLWKKDTSADQFKDLDHKQKWSRKIRKYNKDYRSLEATQDIDTHIDDNVDQIFTVAWCNNLYSKIR
jgi:K+-sensing histidine kinase KdpD